MLELLLASLMFSNDIESEEKLKIATFQADATPPLGTPLCNGGVPPAKKIIDRLSARGIVLLTERHRINTLDVASPQAQRRYRAPIVLCVVDWVGIGNGGYDEWCQALSEAAGTTIDRVSVHTVHQHDAPGCDFSTEKLLAERGLGGTMFDADFARNTIARTASAVQKAIAKPQSVTHLGVGKARVKKFASNRRVLGPDGKVKHVRFSSCKNESVRAAPEGVIDAYVRNLSFWNGDSALAELTYYATHPQSFYGRGAVSADTVGLARSLRSATLPSIAHIHFNGAGGNIAAGKYNDGSPINRLLLAKRLAEGMITAWDTMEKVPICAADIDWQVCPTDLPLRKRLIEEEEKLRKTLDDSGAALRDRIRAARHLVWAERHRINTLDMASPKAQRRLRCKEGHKIELTSLRLGPVYVLHMPGELFVEYQLAAQEMMPDNMVCMAAYGDYGPGYIGTKISYSQGGYETGVVSRVAPEVEEVLMTAIRDLLKLK